MSAKLSNSELHQILLDSLGKNVCKHSDIGAKPLIIKLNPPYNWTLKVYLFNCTNPPGARQAGECKSQIILPGQRRGERGSFEVEPGVITLLMGYAHDFTTGDKLDGVFIIWELKKHMEFAYSANVQVSLASILRAYTEPFFVSQKRGNKEWIVVARRSHIMQAIKARLDKDIEILLEE